jgi:hypothetical protein
MLVLAMQFSRSVVDISSRESARRHEDAGASVTRTGGASTKRGIAPSKQKRGRSTSELQLGVAATVSVATDDSLERR